MLQALGLLVDLVPGNAEDVGQEALDEPVAADDALGDRSLGVERELADTRDRPSICSASSTRRTKSSAALTADKESAKKRLDDTKARMERGEGKVKEFGVELDGIKAQQALELEELRSSHAEAEAKLARPERGGRGAREGRARCARRQPTTRARGRAAARSCARSTRSRRNLRPSEPAQDKRDALEQLRGELHPQHEAKLSEAVSAHKTEFAAALAAHENELRRTREQLEQKAAGELSAEQTDKHTQDMARVGKALAEAEARHTLLEERYEETEAGRTAAERDLRSVTGERDEKAKRIDASPPTYRVRTPSSSTRLKSWSVSAKPWRSAWACWTKSRSEQCRMERETCCEAPSVARTARSVLPVREHGPQRAKADRGVYRAPGDAVLDGGAWGC